MKKALILVELLFLALGLGCLNDTKALGVEHHVEWAREHGFPEPGGTLFNAGVASTVVAALALGFVLGRGAKKRSQRASSSAA